jgi:hypothetical protein
MKNFWESRTLFIKRVLAAGGKVAVDFGGEQQFSFYFFCHREHREHREK